jgi:hypothetical protein
LFGTRLTIDSSQSPECRPATATQAFDRIGSVADQVTRANVAVNGEIIGARETRVQRFEVSVDVADEAVHSFCRGSVSRHRGRVIDFPFQEPGKPSFAAWHCYPPFCTPPENSPETATPMPIMAITMPAQCMGMKKKLWDELLTTNRSPVSSSTTYRSDRPFSMKPIPLETMPPKINAVPIAHGCDE